MVTKKGDLKIWAKGREVFGRLEREVIRMAQGSEGGWEEFSRKEMG